MLRKPISLKRMRKHWGCKALAWVTTVVMASFAVIPAEALTMPRGRPVPVNWDRGLPAGWTQFPPKAVKRPSTMQPDSRTLTDSEMAGIRGKGPYRNKYFNGVLPWQRQLRDVNLCNGNLFKSFTDVQVAPARGAGLVLQRTYNSNDERIGPFGIGWTHAYDIRVAEATTVDNVDRTDFFGGKHTYHRDADGLYTPPAYLFDELSSDYDVFLVNGTSPKVNADTETGMDGTTKHFFLNGDERCCDYIKDRYGNQTNLTYGLQVTIGGVTKNLLTVVTDPSGRTLTFSWTNLGTQQQPAYRITAVQGPVYSVNYAYNTDLNLSSATLDPSGLNRTTTYGYTSYTGQNGSETGLLSSITDPLNHTVGYSYALPTYNPTGTIWVNTVTEPGSGGNHVWTITASYFDYTGYMLTGCSDNDKLGLQVKVDTYLRARMTGLMNSAPAYYTTYDTANNVTQFQEGDTTFSGYWPWMHDSMMGSFSQAHKITTMTYGPHGNVLTQSVTGFSGETTTTTYYDASQYFQKASVTDPLGRVMTFGVGSNTDSNVGNRGSVLYVRDAGYNVVGSPSYQKQFSYSYNSYGQKTSETT